MSNARQFNQWWQAGSRGESAAVVARREGVRAAVDRELHCARLQSRRRSSRA